MYPKIIGCRSRPAHLLFTCCQIYLESKLNGPGVVCGNDFAVFDKRRSTRAWSRRHLVLDDVYIIFPYNNIGAEVAECTYRASQICCLRHRCTWIDFKKIIYIAGKSGKKKLIPYLQDIRFFNTCQRECRWENFHCSQQSNIGRCKGGSTKIRMCESAGQRKQIPGPGLNCINLAYPGAGRQRIFLKIEKFGNMGIGGKQSVTYSKCSSNKCVGNLSGRRILIDSHNSVGCRAYDFRVSRAAAPANNSAATIPPTPAGRNQQADHYCHQNFS